MPQDFETLELVQHRYLALLQSKLHDSLAEVAAFWAAEGSPVTLPDVPAENWYRGNITAGFVYTMFAKLPAITVEAVKWTPSSEPSVPLVDALIVTVHTLSKKNPQEADELSQRYAAAIAKVLAHNHILGVKEALAITVQVDETQDLAYNNYLKSATVTQQLRLGTVV
jgi:hypothetical protein